MLREASFYFSPISFCAPAVSVRDSCIIHLAVQKPLHPLFLQGRLLQANLAEQHLRLTAVLPASYYTNPAMQPFLRKDHLRLPSDHQTGLGFLPLLFAQGQAERLQFQPCWLHSLPAPPPETESTPAPLVPDWHTVKAKDAANVKLKIQVDFFISVFPQAQISEVRSY